VWRNLHDIFLAEAALQAIKHVQRGGSNTNTAVHKLAQIRTWTSNALKITLAVSSGTVSPVRSSASV